MTFVLTPQQLEQVAAMYSGGPTTDGGIEDHVKFVTWIAQVYTDYDLIQLILKGMVVWKYENGDLVFGASPAGLKRAEEQKDQTRRAFGAFEPPKQ